MSTALRHLKTSANGKAYAGTAAHFLTPGGSNIIIVAADLDALRMVMHELRISLDSGMAQKVLVFGDAAQGVGE